MNNKLELFALLTAIAYPVTLLAGGSERVAPSPEILFKDGNVAQISILHGKPSVDGTVAGGAVGSGNMADDITLFGLGVKQQINDQVSYAVTFEQPHWSRASYNNTDPGYPVADSFGKISEERLTLWGKYQASEAFSFYGGPIISRSRTDARVKITNPALPSAALDYSGSTSNATATGFALGFALENKARAQRLSLSYFSELEYDGTGTESASGFNTTTSPPTPYNFPTQDAKLNYKLPQSVTLAAQTGINPKTLITGSIRWADWSEYDVAPSLYGAVTGGASLSKEDHDTVTYTLGVGRKLTDNFSGLAQFSYEESKGDPRSNLSPTDGSKALTLGGVYRMDKYEIRGGVKYTELGDATTTTVNGDFTDNSSVSVGLSFSTQF